MPPCCATRAIVLYWYRTKTIEGGNVAKAEVKVIEIRAEVRQVKTNVDHTINVTLNLPEDCREQAKKLLDWQGLEVFAFISDVALRDSR